jgi:2-methylcitrate dehydratase PrpD
MVINPIQQSHGSKVRAGITSALAVYAAASVELPLPAAVSMRARYHLLDSMAAMISGSRLEAGLAAIDYAKTRSGGGPATVPGTHLSLTPSDAALVNGMTAHADETDDSHARSLTHPGSVVVPAALAAAELSGSTGTQLLRAVTLGYDICCRMGMALGSYDFHQRGLGSHAYGGIFGAAFAAGSLLRFTPIQFQYLASYAAQSASGVTTWVRDSAHVEKAFDFAGMPARNAFEAAMMVRAGFTGVADVFDGDPNFLQIFNPGCLPETLVDGLGTRFEITDTTIKKWCVATPAQASLDGLKTLMDLYQVKPADIARVTASISASSAKVVVDRDMPNVNVQHLLALLLIDGELSFHSAHDADRMQDARVIDARRRVVISPSQTMDPKSRHAIVTVETRDGSRFEHHVTDVRGTPGNPMSKAEVIAKVSGLVAPILGENTAENLIDAVLAIDNVENVQSLRSLLTG